MGVCYCVIEEEFHIPLSPPWRKIILSSEMGFYPQLTLSTLVKGQSDAWTHTPGCMWPSKKALTSLRMFWLVAWRSERIPVPTFESRMVVLAVTVQCTEMWAVRILWHFSRNGRGFVLGPVCRVLRPKLTEFPLWQLLYPSLLPTPYPCSFECKEIDGGKCFWNFLHIC